ncbi:MAG: leucyl aminopeptidase [Nocardioidaceae bacterium]|nr:leucyl aminopeptidase [Nocardioidaceae bacterium]
MAANYRSPSGSNIEPVTTYTLRRAAAEKVRTDVVVVGITTGKGKALVPVPASRSVADAYGRRFAPMLASLGFRGSFGEVAQFPGGDQVNAGRVLAVGLGPGDDLTAEKVRRAAGIAARNLGNAASVALALPAEEADAARAVVEGFGTGLYRYDALRTPPASSRLADVVVLSEAARRADVVDAVRRAQLLVEVADEARDWVNTPGNVLVPEVFAEQIVAAVKGTGIEAEVLDADELARLGCGGILGVGLGSAAPPCLVRLRYAPADAGTSVALVGKGITYDSGGLTIKPGGSMSHMKSDMAGAAAVVAAMKAVAAAKVPVTVTGYLPLAENMISGSAMRPGDVLTTLSGKTVEVLNTDAEGRLILADALTMAAQDRPDSIVEVSTLTGPAVVALGDRIAALFGDDETVAAIEACATRTGELFWRLPIPEEQRDSVRTESKVADLLQHNWVRWGSSLFAAAFLEVFVEGLPWAHLDIAGPSYNTGGPWGHVPSGGTGFATATLVEYVESLAG